MTSEVRVVVLGAGGELGARVCRLAARVPGVAVVAATRSGRGPGGRTAARADVADAASIARLLAPAALLVNCVGPFHYDPAPLVGACVAARAHYCDLADDVAFAERVRAAADAHGAQEAGVCVIPGASTLPGSAGVLARAFEHAPRAQEIARVGVYLCVGSRNPLSGGLLASLLAPLGRAAPGGARWFGERATLVASDGRTLRLRSYPAAFAAGSVSIGARRVPARLYFGFDRAALTGSLALAAPALGALPARAIAPLARALLPFARLARWAGTPRGLLALVAEDAHGRELSRVELAARAEGLDVPAAPPAWLAARLAHGFALPAGHAELADAIPLADVLSWARSDNRLALGLPGEGAAAHA